jgi:hypothetical protein
VEAFTSTSEELFTSARRWRKVQASAHWLSKEQLTMLATLWLVKAGLRWSPCGRSPELLKDSLRYPDLMVRLFHVMTRLSATPQETIEHMCGMRYLCCSLCDLLDGF